MASVGPMNAGMKQTRGYFVPLGNCCDKIYTPLVSASGAGGSFVPGTFTAGALAWRDNAATRTLLSSISSVGAGGILRDMGKTVVSSNRSFRKVQLIAGNTSLANSSFSSVVQGNGTTSVGPFLTGYIELLTGQSLDAASAASAAPVAYMPGLI